MTGIIMINLDDASPNILPHLAQSVELGAAGFQFTNNIISTPVCSPSRASTLTGKHSHNTGCLQNGGEDGSYRAFMANDNEDQTMATLLDAAGWKCGLFGKYINGYRPDGDTHPGYGYPELHVPAGWTEWFALGDGYQQFNYEAVLKTTGAASLVVAEDNLEGNYLTDVIKTEVLAFLDRRFAGDFLAVVCPFATHIGVGHDPEDPSGPQYPPAPRDRPLSDERPDDWDPPEFPDTGDLGVLPFMWPDPPDNQNFGRRPSNAPAWYPSKDLSQNTMDAYERHHRDRIQQAQSVDDLIVAVRAKLVALGVDDTTWIVVTTDNGYHLGEHALPTGKGSPYDEDCRLPLVIYPPGGADTPAVIDAMVQNVDFLPTFLDIAGVTRPADVDGRSLLGFMDGGAPPSPWRKTALIEFNTPDFDQQGSIGTGEPPPSFSLRSQDILYTTYEPQSSAPPPPQWGELYDSSDDPWQLANLWPTVTAESGQALQDMVADYTTTAGAANWAIACQDLPDIEFGDAAPQSTEAVLYVNGWLLPDYATVHVGSDTWGVPPLRGENLVVPTKGGRVLNDGKVYDENTGSINLWAQGLGNLDRAVTLFARNHEITTLLSVRGDVRRRLLIEVTDRVPITPFGAVNGHIVMDYTAPYSFWEDEVRVEQTLELDGPDRVLQFFDFAGGQMPIEDAVITITGRVDYPMVQCAISEEWFKLMKVVGPEGKMVADCAEHSVIVTNSEEPNGIERIDLVDQKRTGPLLRIQPKLEDGRVMLRITCDSIKGTPLVTVRARRKYVRGS